MSPYYCPFYSGFVGAKPPIPGINNYRKLFKDATPAMDDAANAGFKVHHKYQVLRARRPETPETDPGSIDPAEAATIDGVMAIRFQKQLQINVHSKEHLAAVTDDVHGKIGGKQKQYWNQKFKDAGIDPDDPAKRLGVYESVPIQDYKKFCDDLDAQYKDYYLSAGSSKADFEKLRQNLDSVQGQQRFQLDELRRRKNLFPDSVIGPGTGPGMTFLLMFNPNVIDQLRDIRKHNPYQQAAFQDFVNSYLGALDEIEQFHRLRSGTAHRLLDSFGDYIELLGLHENNDNWWVLFKAAAGRYIDLYLIE